MAGLQHPSPTTAAHRRRRVWISAVLLSTVGHTLLLPTLLARLTEKVELPLELTYLDPDSIGDSATTDSANPVPLSPEAESKTQPKDKPLDPKKQPVEDEKVAERREKKPEPETPQPKPEVKPLEVTVMPHLKMVDQEQFPDEQDNKDARYLAQKNHAAAIDTQASSRNLIQQIPGETQASAPSENQSPQIGEAQQKSAELQDRPGDPKRLPQQAPPPTPVARMPNLAVAMAAQPSAKQSTPEAQSLGREQSPGGETMLGDGQVLLKQGGGAESRESQGRAERAEGVAGAPGLSPSRLRYQDYDRIVGYDVAESERRTAARAERSQGMGRWDRIMAKQALFRASLENFTPNVRVGNQSELGTRAHPFAAYIAQVHRQIHRFWGDGFLADLDRKVGSDVYDRKLVTALELSIKPDGTLGQVVIARTSGVLPFDAAAIDAVGSAAPFGEPPQAIKSRDGNVYITWHFHRDERQCATDFVNAHILTTPPKAGSGTPLPPASKPLVASATKSREEPRGDQPSELQQAPRPAPARLSLGVPRSGGSRGAGIDSVEPAAPIKANALTKVPDDAKSAAERWLDAFERKDAKRMSAGSALPFTSGGKPIASDATTLRAFFDEMMSEGIPKRDRLHFYTLPEVRTRLGRVPRGSDGDEVAFAWVEQGGEDLILLLEPTDKGWKVVGLER